MAGRIELALNSSDQEYLVVLFGQGGQKDLLGISVNNCVSTVCWMPQQYSQFVIVTEERA